MLLFRKMAPKICAKVTDTPAVYDNMGDVLNSFMRQKSLFITENEKGATKTNEVSQQFKAKTG